MLPDASWPPGKEAPGALELLRRFCNSSNPENGAERFRDPDQLDAWLEVEGLAPIRVDHAGLRRVIRFRGQLRALAVANRDGRIDRVAFESLVAGCRWWIAATRDRRARPRADGTRSRRVAVAGPARVDHRDRPGRRVVVTPQGVHQRPLPVDVLRPQQERQRGVVLDDGLWATPQGPRIPSAPVGCRRAVAGLTVAHALASLGIAAAATRDRSGTAFDATQPRPLGDRVEAGKDERVECGRRRDVLRPHACLDAEEMVASVVRPAGARLERADVVETRRCRPNSRPATSSRRRTPCRGSTHRVR